MDNRAVGHRLRFGGRFYWAALFVALLVLGLFAFTGGLTLGLNTFADWRGAAEGPDWGAQERVNLLILGTDGRPDEGAVPVRSDTMMIVSIDPYARTGVVLSVPRDIWVKIPVTERNVVEERINAACFLGDAYNYPGGCPGVARRAVEANLGIKIHYYVAIDFTGFERIIDALGGIDVDVEKPVKDDEYPTADYSTMRIYIPPGLNHFDGKTALIYARTRHADSDFQRTRRQQQVLVAARQRALQLDILPRLPQLYAEFKDAIKTDMNLADMLALANAGKDIDLKNVQFRTLDGPYIQPVPGQTIYLLNQAAVRRLIDELFVDTRLRDEAARVEVLNATNQSGLASRVAGALREKGFVQVTFDNYAGGRSAETLIIDYTGKKYSIKQLSALFPGARVQTRANGPAGVDIQLILGEGARVP